LWGTAAKRGGGGKTPNLRIFPLLFCDIYKSRDIREEEKVPATLLADVALMIVDRRVATKDGA